MKNKTLKVNYVMRWSQNRKVPKIQLSGDWLQELGFDINSQILITSKKNKIIISRKES